MVNEDQKPFIRIMLQSSQPPEGGERGLENEQDPREIIYQLGPGRSGNYTTTNREFNMRVLLQRKLKNKKEQY